MSDTPKPSEDSIDAALDDSFPASDPPSTSTPETSIGIDDEALRDVKGPQGSAKTSRA